MPFAIAWLSSLSARPGPIVGGIALPQYLRSESVSSGLRPARQSPGNRLTNLPACWHIRSLLLRMGADMNRASISLDTRTSETPYDADQAFRSE
jgi:hypothetical protein